MSSDSESQSYDSGLNTQSARLKGLYKTFQAIQANIISSDSEKINYSIKLLLRQAHDSLDPSFMCKSIFIPFLFQPPDIQIKLLSTLSIILQPEPKLLAQFYSLFEKSINIVYLQPFVLRCLSSIPSIEIYQRISSIIHQLSQSENYYIRRLVLHYLNSLYLNNKAPSNSEIMFFLISFAKRLLFDSQNRTSALLVLAEISKTHPQTLIPFSSILLSCFYESVQSPHCFAFSALCTIFSSLAPILDSSNSSLLQNSRTIQNLTPKQDDCISQNNIINQNNTIDQNNIINQNDIINSNPKKDSNEFGIMDSDLFPDDLDQTQNNDINSNAKLHLSNIHSILLKDPNCLKTIDSSTITSVIIESLGDSPEFQFLQPAASLCQHLSNPTLLATHIGQLLEQCTYYTNDSTYYYSILQGFLLISKWYPINSQIISRIGHCNDPMIRGMVCQMVHQTPEKLKKIVSDILISKGIKNQPYLISLALELAPKRGAWFVSLLFTIHDLAAQSGPELLANIIRNLKDPSTKLLLLSETKDFLSDLPDDDFGIALADLIAMESNDPNDWFLLLPINISTKSQKFQCAMIDNAVEFFQRTKFEIDQGMQNRIKLLCFAPTRSIRQRAVELLEMTGKNNDS